MNYDSKTPFMTSCKTIALLENEFGGGKKRLLFCTRMLYHLYMYSLPLYRPQISLVYIESEVSWFHLNFKIISLSLVIQSLSHSLSLSLSLNNFATS